VHTPKIIQIAYKIICLSFSLLTATSILILTKRLLLASLRGCHKSPVWLSSLWIGFTCPNLICVISLIHWLLSYPQLCDSVAYPFFLTWKPCWMGYFMQHECIYFIHWLQTPFLCDILPMYMCLSYSLKVTPWAQVSNHPKPNPTCRACPLHAARILYTQRVCPLNQPASSTRACLYRPTALSCTQLARINVQLPTPHLSPIIKHRLPIRHGFHLDPTIIIQAAFNNSFHHDCPTQMPLRSIFEDHSD